MVVSIPYLSIKTFFNKFKSLMSLNFVYKINPSDLKDPVSAQLTELLYVKDSSSKSEFLCGMVNAKNSYGGYIGAKPFYVQKFENPINENSQNQFLTWIAGQEEVSVGMEGANIKLAMAYCGVKSAIPVQ